MLKVFIGPSGFDGIEDCGALRLLPPAQRGDLYTQAKALDTSAIALIDGVFGTTPSVLHKEILWALSQAMPVYGAASIGAIRAAEMDQFGMVGYGWIYQAYARGRHRLADPAVWASPGYGTQHTRDAMHAVWLRHLLDGDALTDEDDVALHHMPAEFAYRPLSEPLVNMIRTFQAAPLSEQLKRQALLAAKQTFFPHRGYPEVLARLAEKNLFEQRELAELADWTRDQPVNQKAADARGLIAALAAGEMDRAASKPQVDFIETSYWAGLCRRSADGEQ